MFFVFLFVWLFFLQSYIIIVRGRVIERGAELGKEQIIWCSYNKKNGMSCVLKGGLGGVWWVYKVGEATPKKEREKELLMAFTFMKK